MSVTRSDQILDFAEAEMRKGGFDAVSFRDIASAIGIKSASVHYHFPTKVDLGTAVAHRYTERFIDGLGASDNENESARDRIERLADAYIGAYRTETSTCLCTVLGSVVTNLPEETATEVRIFYNRLLGWVRDALDGGPVTLTPEVVVSMLQGAMVLSIAQGNAKPLNDARALLVASV